MNNRETVCFNAKMIPVKPLNNELSLCKCYVMALGKNRNHSYISQDVADKATPTIYNIPVVGHVYVDEDGEYHMGGHDITLVRDEQGRAKFKSLCVPFGVVPDNNDIHYEEIIDSNGNKVTYQVANVILWTGRYPELNNAIYNDDIYFGQSMEINVNATEPLSEDRKYTQINDYSYSALCLLGKSDDPDFNVEPCFPDSRVEPYKFSIDTETFGKLMNEFKAEVGTCFRAINFEKGGDSRMTSEVYNSVLAEYDLNEEDIKFETENMTEEQFRAKLDEMKADNADEPIQTADFEQSDEVNKEDETEADAVPQALSQTDDNTEDEENTQKSEFAKLGETYIAKINALGLALSNMNVADYDGGVFIYYYLNDVDEDYVYFNEHKYAVGQPEESKNYKAKYVYDGNVASIENYFEEITQVWLTNEELEKLDQQKAEYQELKSFRDERLENDRIEEYNAVISEFSDLNSNEEFAKIVEDKMSFETADALREKCFAVRGKTMVIAPVTKNKEMKFSIQPVDDTENEPYGGLFKKYPPKSLACKK